MPRTINRDVCTQTEQQEPTIFHAIVFGLNIFAKNKTKIKDSIYCSFKTQKKRKKKSDECININ